MRSLKSIVTAGMAALMFSAASASAAPGDPVAVIKKTDRIKFLINDIFDFEELGRRALGAETWKSATPDQQKRFVKAFREMVENASVKKLEVYQSDSSAY